MPTFWRSRNAPVRPRPDLQCVGESVAFAAALQRRSGSSLTTRSPKPPAIFTIGHSTHPWTEFRDVLRAHGIERVVDVRTIPRSRHNPQFNRDALSRKLRGAKIGYVHLHKLGGLRHARTDSTNTGWRNSSFRGYADYMQTAEFAEALQRLIKLGSQKRCAIMCAEAVPWRCHRSLIADALNIRKMPVFHIISAAKPRRHSLTPFAKVHGHVITYPPSTESMDK